MQVISLQPIATRRWEVGLTGRTINKINSQKKGGVIDIVSILLVISSCFIWLFFI